jgi:lipid-A-disaccharide synthase-like uncharacterized protein
MMQTFSMMMAVLGSLVALIYFYSFWTALGVVYMTIMLLIAVIAFWRRRQPTGSGEETH